MLKLNNIEKIIGSGLYSGFIPLAPGTMGSIVALLVYLIPGIENPVVLSGLIIVFLFWGKVIADKFETEYGKDPKQCVVDEWVGTWISLLFIPKTVSFIIISFVIWRMLDILKPFPADRLENLKGGWGIMLDDVISGVYTFIIIHIIIYFVN